MNNKKILVTGGSGFIGSHLIDYLLKSGHQVTNFDVKCSKWHNHREIENLDFVCADIRNECAIENECANHDIIFHLAGLLGTEETIDDLVNTCDINTQGTLKVFKAIKGTDIRAVYITLGNDWCNPYTITKTAARDFAYMFNKYLGTKISIVKGMNIYGTRQKWLPIRKAVPRFIVDAIDGKPLEIFGTGNQTIDLLHTDDMSKILWLASQVDCPKDNVIQAGLGISYTVFDLAKHILACVHNDKTYIDMSPEELQSKGLVKLISLRMGEPENSQTLADTDNLEKILKYKPSIELYDGMKRTVDWYKDNYKEMLKH